MLFCLVIFTPLGIMQYYAEWITGMSFVLFLFFHPKSTHFIQGWWVFKNNFMGIPWQSRGLGLCTAEGPGSAPSWETKSPQAVVRSQKKKQEKISRKTKTKTSWQKKLIKVLWEYFFRLDKHGEQYIYMVDYGGKIYRSNHVN